QQERAEELAAFAAQLARLARVVDGEALRQVRLRLGLEEAERLVQRHRRRNDALNADRIELLELLQLPRFGGRAQRSERRQRDELVLGPGDVDLRQLIRGQAFHARHL